MNLYIAFCRTDCSVSTLVLTYNSLAQVDLGFFSNILKASLNATEG